MSGGHFDYVQFRIDDAAEELKRLADVSNYPEDIKKSFLESANILEEAAARLTQVDLLVSGDNGEDSYRKGLEEALANLER